MIVYQLSITENLDYGYDRLCGGDHEHSHQEEVLDVLDELYATRELVMAKLESLELSISKFYRTTQKVDEPKIKVSNYPIDEIMADRHFAINVVNEQFDYDPQGYDIEWYHHFFEIIIKEYNVRESIY